MFPGFLCGDLCSGVNTAEAVSTEPKTAPAENRVIALHCVQVYCVR